MDAELLAIASGKQGHRIYYLPLRESDLSGAAGLKTKEEKARYVYERLTQAAGRTQPAMLAALSKLGVEARPYWIANMIWVRGDLGAIQAIAQRTDVRHIYANPTVRFEEPVQNTQLEPPGSLQSAGVPWNIQKVNAPAVWAAGFTGQGVVIGGQDTGYNWNHPALMDKYRLERHHSRS
jgi:subtilisin family serine protease